MNSPMEFLSGENLYLRPLELADAEGAYPAWLNDAEVCAGNSHHLMPYSREDAREFIRTVAQNKDQLTLAIVLRDGNRHVGNIALQKWHRLYRSAEFAIMLGDRGAWGKGVGFEAARLLLDHGFSALNLHRVYCGTFADNAGMIALAKKLGMKEEGLRRDAALKDGRFVSVIDLGVLAGEYRARFDKEA